MCTYIYNIMCWKCLSVPEGRLLYYCLSLEDKSNLWRFSRSTHDLTFQVRNLQSSSIMTVMARYDLPCLFSMFFGHGINICFSRFIKFPGILISSLKIFKDISLVMLCVLTWIAQEIVKVLHCHARLKLFRYSDLHIH